MRSKPQSALRAPLNKLLGTEANVRLLRVLALAETPLAAGELAKRAELGRTSIYPALETLEGAGIVTFVGAGAQRQASFRRGHPLGRAVMTLFREEAQRLDALVAALRVLADTLRPHPTGVWLEGVNEPTPRTLRLYILADPKSLPKHVDAMSARVGPIEREHDVHIEVRGTTRSELTARVPRNQAHVLDDAVPITGGIPRSVRLGEPTTVKATGGHEAHDVRARRLGLAIAEKIKRDPGIVRRALKRVQKRQLEASEAEQRELIEWTRLLSLPAVRVRRLLEEQSELATRLRQTLPALDVLTPAEREAVLAATSDAEALAVVKR